MIKKIEFKLDEGEIVYLKADPEQLPRVIIGYLIRENIVLYELSSAEGVTYHVYAEISKQSDSSLFSNMSTSNE